MIVAGMGTSPPDRTISEAFLTVLPFKDPISGPNMSSALMMSCPVTSQFKIRPVLASSMNLFVLGLPILVCVVRAFSAR
jgi:hypothetical protein